GNSGGILCVLDPICYYKENVTKSDSFVMIHGVWRATGVKLLIIAVYAPHEQKEKHLLWDYLEREIKRTLNVRGVLVDGSWIDNPIDVKDEFFNHFSTRFRNPDPKDAYIEMDFPNVLSQEDRHLLNERYLSMKLKRQCGIVGRIKLRVRMDSLLVSIADIGI
nr:RNA-directed DNA polymerase, eukaryota [Tanacetum cinerariifolium]